VYKQFEWSYWGLLGAITWFPASCLSIFSVRLIGISIAQSIWSGVTILVAFSTGVCFFNESFTNLPLSILGVCFLVAGIVLISVSNLVSIKFIFERISYDPQNPQTLNKESNPLIFANTDNTAINDNEEETPKKLKKGVMYIMGISLSIIMGILNGMSMIPVKFEENAINYMFTFGVSQFFIGNLLVGFYFIIIKTAIFKDVTLSRAQLIKTSISGIICGTLWVIGYFGQVVSVLSTLGIAVGFVLIQTTIIISSLVGLIFFKELRGLLKILTFITGLVCVFGGVILLFYFKVV